jgi:3-methyladenine DNA glycosylase AlkD
MSTATEILKELEALGSASVRNVLIKHGAIEGKIYGVKAGDLKPIEKRIKRNYQLALDLYDSGISDAMYLAGLIADESKMTKAQIQLWCEQAYWYYLSEYAVPWVAASSQFGQELGLEWIDSSIDHIACSGWRTLGDWISIKPDTELDIELYRSLLQRAEQQIGNAPNRVKYVMNGFVIAIGTHIAPLHDAAIEAGTRIGKVKVNMGDTACKVPYSVEYIHKVLAANGGLTKKKKKLKC